MPETADSFTFRHEAMATYFEIVIAGQSADYARQAASAAFRELDRLEAELSRFVESSDISRANRLARGESITITDDTLECLLVAADVSVATRRAFDPAYASKPAADAPPDAPLFTLDPAAHTLTSLAERLHLDLGAVGKGHALDRLAATLREWDIAAACLNSGGSSVLAFDSSATTAGWPITIGSAELPHPRTLHLSDAALSGSGIAVKGAHVIDPRHGAAATRTSRVWALATSAALSDALSTAFFVMRDLEIEAFCDAHPEIGAAVIGARGELAAYGTLRTQLEF